MKLVLLVLSIIVVLITVHCSGRNVGSPDYIADAPEWRDSDETHLKKRDVEGPVGRYLPDGPEWHKPPKAHHRPDIEEGKDQNEQEARKYPKCRGKPTPTCAVQGGYCVHKKAPCKGRRVTGQCDSKRCDCCIPVCPYEEGFFSPTDSRQCFKLFDDTSRNWTQAETKCQAESPGLRLAHPYNAIALRSYMVQRFGWDSISWLNARGGDWYITWEDNGEPIDDYNLLWYQDQPRNTSDRYCLLLLADSWSWYENATRPYYVIECSYPYFYTLCELVIADAP